MMPRLHPETKENQHKRFAQHIGPPCHGAMPWGHAMGLEFSCIFAPEVVTQFPVGFHYFIQKIVTILG